jgi:hypothetical protein
MQQHCKFLFSTTGLANLQAYAQNEPNGVVDWRLIGMQEKVGESFLWYRLNIQ